MKMNFKILRVLPFVALLVFAITSWIEILTVTHVAKIRHLIGGGLILINILVYAFSLRMGVLLTGITLLLATINLAAFTTTITTKQYWVGFYKFKLATPVFQPTALLILVVFLGFNLKYLLEAFKKMSLPSWLNRAKKRINE